MANHNKANYIQWQIQVLVSIQWNLYYDDTLGTPTSVRKGWLKILSITKILMGR